MNENEKKVIQITVIPSKHLKFDAYFNWLQKIIEVGELIWNKALEELSAQVKR